MTAQKKSPMGALIGVLVLLLIIGGGAFLYMNLGNVAKSLAEKIGSETLGVPVRIANMEIVPHEKRIEVTGLTIGNPSGYKDSESLRVGTIRIVADSLSKELLVFNEIAVEDTNINLEVNQKGTNLSDLQKNIKPKASADQKTESGEPIKVIVKKLTLNGATLNPRVVLLSDTVKPVMMPDIQLTGIGQKTNGVLVSEAAAQVFDHITKVATKTASQQGLLQGMDQEAMKDMAGQMGVQLKDGLKGDIENKAKGLVNEMKGLF